jgi:type I restriction enzyme, S subunit
MNNDSSPWIALQLGDVCQKIGSGSTPRGGGSVYAARGVPFIRSQNVLNSGFSRDGLTYLSDELAFELRNVAVVAGDILVNITGDSVARVCRPPADVLPARVSQHVAIIRPDPERLDPSFLRYYLIQPAVQVDLLGLASAGATRNALTKAMLERLKIVAPQDVHQQRAVVRPLVSIDNKIELNRCMRQTLGATAQSIFQAWFVDSEAEDAQVVSLRELTIKIGSGATPRGGRDVYVDNGTALIRSQNVYDSQFVWDGLARITDEAATQLANVQVQPGDVLLNITGASILRTCVVPPDVLPARVNQHVAIIRAKPGVSPHYLHLHLLQPETKAYLLGLNAGGSREAVTKAHIESVPLMDPGAERMNAFHQAVAPFFALAQSLDAENRKLASLRDELLPKLLSAELKPGILEDADAAMIAEAVGA